MRRMVNIRTFVVLLANLLAVVFLSFTMMVDLDSVLHSGLKLAHSGLPLSNSSVHIRKRS
jgi:hypothetical protein